MASHDQRLGDRYWPTDKAIAVLDGRPPIRLDQEQLRDLANDLVEMDSDGAIDLTRWPAAAALVDAAFPIRNIENAPTGGDVL